MCKGGCCEHGGYGERIRPNFYQTIVNGIVVQLSGKRDRQNVANHGEDELFIGIPLDDCRIERLLNSIYHDEVEYYNFPWGYRKSIKTNTCCRGVHITLPIGIASHPVSDTYYLYLEKHIKDTIKEAIKNHCCDCCHHHC